MTTTPATSADATPRAGVVWDDALGRYDFGIGHPMDPVRLELTHRLAVEAGLLGRPGVEILPAPVASDEALATVHDPQYVAAVRAASDPRTRPSEEALLPYGLGSEDTPVFDGIHEASARLVGGTVEAMEAIRAGRVTRAVCFAGGMHHARASQAAGFCVYNDAAVAIRRALAEGVERIVYVDLDAHHGDGVERALWDEPRAITISIHETGEVLFPGTGFVQDTGGAGAEGSAVNIPLPPRVDAGGWLRAVRATIPALVRAMRPTILVTQHGCDTHRDDPLADLRLTVEGQIGAMLLMRELADEVCEGRWLALGGGGYSVMDVVPRSWAALVSIATGEPLPPDGPLPAGYVEHLREVAAATAMPLPRRLSTIGDGAVPHVRPWEDGYDPEDPLDRAVQAARRVAFPEWGLDPFYD